MPNDYSLFIALLTFTKTHLTYLLYILKYDYIRHLLAS